MDVEQAVAFLRGVLDRMGLGGDIVAAEDDERITLEIREVDSGLVIGRQGATLDALQYLVNKAMSRSDEEGHKPIAVDAEGYRGRRAESLTELALRLAEKARKTRKPVPVHPMSAADRRVMHLALADVPGVTTRSEGEGAMRRLIVIPDAGAGMARTPADGSEGE
jgi:spoIIIJ-associated protein